MEDEKERPFTDEEMIKLFAGEPNQPYLKDVMLIGALTGARIDAIVVSGKLTPSGVVRACACIADRRFTSCELLCLRLALEPETSI
jgi:hypothetical protein